MEQLRQALQEAEHFILHVMEVTETSGPIFTGAGPTLRAVRAALQQPTAEPVAWLKVNQDGREITISATELAGQWAWVKDLWRDAKPLYDAPPALQGDKDDKRDGDNALQRMREFVGWLSGDVPELHGVEVPRLAESLDRFLLATDSTMSKAESTEPKLICPKCGVDRYIEFCGHPSVPFMCPMRGTTE